MEQRISIITLGVGDLPRARAFYGRLGFKEASISQDGIAFFSMGTFVFALYPIDGLADDVGEPLPATTTGGVTLAYNVREKSDVAQTLAEAVEAGARLVKPAEDVFWGGHSGYFADLDGHLWEVAWNPHSPLAEDRSLQIS